MNQNPQMEAEIAACEKKLYAAMLASDVTALQELIADNLLFVGPSGEIVTKQMDLSTHRSGSIAIARLELKEQEIRCLDGAAVAVSRLSLAGTFLDAPFEGDFRYTRVWQSTVRGWRIIAGHCSAVTQL